MCSLATGMFLFVPKCINLIYRVTTQIKFSMDHWTMVSYNLAFDSNFTSSNVCQKRAAVVYYYWYFTLLAFGKLTPCLKERRRALGLAGVPSVGRFVPECMPDGQYSQMQCFGNTDFCWCSDKNGYEIAGTHRWGTPQCPVEGEWIHLYLIAQSQFKSALVLSLRQAT